MEIDAGCMDSHFVYHCIISLIILLIVIADFVLFNLAVSTVISGQTISSFIHLQKLIIFSSQLRNILLYYTQYIDKNIYAQII